MSRMRTFIAVDMGKTLRDRVVAVQASLAGAGTEVKWVEPENLHVTLLFLGEVDMRQIPVVCKVVAEVTGQQTAFSMSVETVGCFPNLRRPRVVWVGVGEGTQELCALHDALEQPLMDLGCYRREDRKYTPHITLGRVRSERSTGPLAAALAKKTGWKAGEVAVREVLVMGSELTPQGPIYTVLGRGKLG